MEFKIVTHEFIQFLNKKYEIHFKIYKLLFYKHNVQVNYLNESFKLFQAERLADYGRLLSGSQPALDGRKKDLDRIQDLFPNDFLNLHASDPNGVYHILQKTKSLRKKSTGDFYNFDVDPCCKRVFIVEAPCAMAPPQIPVMAKSRHLFLFTDLLLVAKPKSGGTFKLKVRFILYTKTLSCSL